MMIALVENAKKCMMMMMMMMMMMIVENAKRSMVERQFKDSSAAKTYCSSSSVRVVDNRVAA